jgi:L-rhamnose mutarotase
MIRKAFRMSVNPDQYQEYEDRHNPIWKELEEVLKAHGVHNYSIFFDPNDSSLFAYVEIEDEARHQTIAQTEVCQRWWKFMSELMPSNPDNSPKSIPLKEVFHLD